MFNFIDILGYVDFSYEVFCFIVVCEGVFLLVDVFQGIQVQIIFNFYLVIEYDFEIILIFNKVDMESVMIDEVFDQIIDFIGCEKEDIFLVSGKIGCGVFDIMEVIVECILVL